jgi:hypothetical protein
MTPDLSLPLIKSGYIDDAIHRGWAVVGCVLLHAQGAQQESPLPAIGTFEQCCDNPCRTAANAAGAARRTPRHDRDIPDGSSRSGAPHSHSASENAVMSDDRGCRGNEFVESSFRCRQVYNGLHLIAAELILDVREGGHRSDDKDGVGVLIPNFKMTRFHQYLTIQEMISLGL